MFFCVLYYLGAFGTVWLPFDAKRAELVQKFVPRSRVGIFHNERNRSTPLDPKVKFWCVSYYLGAFGTVWLPHKTRCKTSRTSAKFMPRSRVGIFRNEHTRSSPLDPKRRFGAFHTIWVHSGPFGCLTKLGSKRAELVQNSCHEVASELFATNAPDPPH